MAYSMSCANVVSKTQMRSLGMRVVRWELDDNNNLKGNLGNTPSFSLEGAGENLSLFPKKKWTPITYEFQLAATEAKRL